MSDETILETVTTRYKTKSYPISWEAELPAGGTVNAVTIVQATFILRDIRTISIRPVYTNRLRESGGFTPELKEAFDRLRGSLSKSNVRNKAGLLEDLRSAELASTEMAVMRDSMADELGKLRETLDYACREDGQSPFAGDVSILDVKIGNRSQGLGHSALPLDSLPYRFSRIDTAMPAMHIELTLDNRSPFNLHVKVVGSGEAVYDSVVMSRVEGEGHTDPRTP